MVGGVHQIGPSDGPIFFHKIHIGIKGSTPTQGQANMEVDGDTPAKRVATGEPGSPFR